MLETAIQLAAVVMLVVAMMMMMMVMLVVMLIMVMTMTGYEHVMIPYISSKCAKRAFRL